MILLQIVMVSPGSPKLKCLGLYVTRQLIWRQMQKPFFTLYWKKKSHTPDILLQKIFKSMDHSLCLTGHIPLLFCIFGDLYASGTQDAEITKSLHVQQMYMIFCNSSSPDSNEICLRLTSVRQKTILNIVWEVFCIRTGEGHKVLASIGRSLTSFLALLKIDR